MAITVPSSNVTDASATSVTVIKPTGVVEGDLMIASINGYSDTAINIATPSGWTAIRQNKLTSDRFSLATFSKIAGASEPANYTFSMTAGTTPRMSGAILRIVGGNIIDTSSQNSEATTNTTATGSSVTPTYANSLILFIIYNGGSDTSNYAIATDNPTWTEIVDFYGSAQQGNHIAYAIRPETTATGNATATQSNSFDIVHMIVVKEFPTFSSLETITNTESKLLDTSFNNLETNTLTEDVDNDVSRVWNKTNKPSTTWTNKQK